MSAYKEGMGGENVPVDQVNTCAWSYGVLFSIMAAAVTYPVTAEDRTFSPSLTPLSINHSLVQFPRASAPGVLTGSLRQPEPLPSPVCRRSCPFG